MEGPVSLGPAVINKIDSRPVAAANTKGDTRAPGTTVGRVSDGLAGATAVVAGALMLVLVGIVLYEIYGRLWIPGGAATWTNEVSTYLLVWITFLGASLSVAKGEQPRITALFDRLHGKTHEMVAWASDAAALLIYGYLVIVGIQLVIFDWNTTETNTGLPYAVVTFAVPVGGSLMLFQRVCQLVEQHKARTVIPVAVAIVLGIILVTKPQLQTAAFYPVLFAILVLCLALSVPIAESLLLSAVFAYNLAGGFGSSNVTFAAHIYGALSNFTFVAVPLFLFTGVILSLTPLAVRLIAFVRSLVSWLPGGLGVSVVGTSAVFADISGSAAADTVAIGTVMIPQLEEEGYPKPFAAGLQAASGTLGLLFPPSITMLLYAAASNSSVAFMFASLIIPGVLAAFSLAAVTAIIASRRGYGQRAAFNAKNSLRLAFWAVPALGTIVIILGGLFEGLFTASEAGAVASFYALLVGSTEIIIVSRLRARRSRNGGSPEASQPVAKQVMAVWGNSASTAARTTARVTFIISGALSFGYLIVLNNAPQNLVSALSGISTNALVIVGLLMIALVVIHTFLDVSSTILVIVPLLLPLLAQLNFPLGQFGVLVQLNSALGLVLPPLGLNLYLVSSISSLKVESVAKAVLPFAAVIALDLLLILFIPQITSFLPSLLGLTGG